jgi:hypothetical protein
MYIAATDCLPFIITATNKQQKNAMRLLHLFPLVASATAAVVVRDVSAISVEKDVPSSAGPALLESYMSYSIEFCYFPDYAGT